MPNSGEALASVPTSSGGSVGSGAWLGEALLSSYTPHPQMSYGPHMSEHSRTWILCRGPNRILS